MTLSTAKPENRSAGCPVCGNLRLVDDDVQALDHEVLDLVRSEAAHGGRPDWRSGIGAGLEPEMHLTCGELAVFRGTDLYGHPAAGRGSGRPEHLVAIHHDLDGTACLLREPHCERLEVGDGLAAEPATDLGRNDLDSRRLPAKHLGAVGTHGEMALRRAPHGRATIGSGVSDRSVRLDVALVDRFGGELVLDHDVGIGEALVEVAALVHDPAGDVRRFGGRRFGALGDHPVVQQGRTGRHRLVDVEHVRQGLVYHLDGVQSSPGLGAARGRNRGHDVALVQGLVAGDHVADHVLVTPGSLGEVVAGDDCLDPGHGLGLRRIDRHDLGVGVRRTQHRPLEHARQVEIGAELGPTGDLLEPVGSNRTGADPLVARVGRCWIFGDGHA